MVGWFCTLAVLTLCSACALPLGKTSESTSSESVETVKIATIEDRSADMIAIRVLAAEDGAKFISVMEELQKNGEFTFTKDASGMVASINGKANAADWSACWMLYTSDAELSSTEFGSYEYKGTVLGSANLGADALPVVNGEVYIWVYTSF